MTDMNKLEIDHLEAAYPSVAQLVETVRGLAAELLPPAGVLRSSVFTPAARRCAQCIELLEMLLALHSADAAADGKAVLYTLRHKRLGELGVYTSLDALFSGLVYKIATGLSITEHLVIRRGVANGAGEIEFSHLL